MHRKISKAGVARLSLYYRALITAEGKGVSVVSSKVLSEKAGTNAAQLRSDLASFGSFGKRGAGYNVKALKGSISGILGKGRRWRVALVGVGNLGTALLSYGGFKEQGFDIVAAFDADPKKIGKKLRGVTVRKTDSISRILPKDKVDIGIITVPAEFAQDVADRLVKGGVRAIINFAPINLDLPDNVTVNSVDLSVELNTISYLLDRNKRL
ncbi:MAG: redox-sensing transcriptional repressor Rex [Candidatus Omnitrophica bacterium]|nr:redox-sensing transcriptional repressor Rex [Candidatus Omnitrophota bacterium]